MFVISFHATKKKIAAACCLVIAVAVAGTIMILGGGAEPVDAAAQGDTNERRIEYLNSMGWNVEEEALEVQDVVIPAEFDSIYEVYNSIQKQQGFDLYDYRGEVCKQYVYQITDYPDSDNMVATLLVHNGKIIGGDISSTEQEGYMHRLQRSDTSPAESEQSLTEQSDTEQTNTESEQSGIVPSAVEQSDAEQSEI